jgi:uroporphyrinogen-III synthase
MRPCILSTSLLDRTLLKLADDKEVELDAFPFIRIELVSSIEMRDTIDELYRRSIAAVFTSANAVRAVCDNREAPADWSVFCLDSATQDAVLKYFPEDQIKGTGANAESLAASIAEAGVKELVFFCGNKRMDTLPGLLKGHGIVVNEQIVYNTMETPQRLSTEYDAVLFFSPSGVQSFFKSNTLKQNAVIFAIGTTTAQAIKEYSDNEIIVASHTSKTQIVLDAINYFNTIKQRTVNTLQ